MVPNEFWLNLHRLCDSYDSEGLTPDERAGNIAAQFRDMPHIAQRQVLGELLRVATYLPDLYPVIVAVAHEREKSVAEKRDKRAS